MLNLNSITNYIFCSLHTKTILSANKPLFLKIFHNLFILLLSVLHISIYIRNMDDYGLLILVKKH